MNVFNIINTTYFKFRKCCYGFVFDVYIGVKILFKKNSFAVNLEFCHLTCQISSFKETKIPALLFGRILNLSKSNPSTEEKQNEI